MYLREFLTLFVLCFILKLRHNIPIALLLCTVNTEERRSMHEDVILWWLDHEPIFDLYIVDSTTNSFHPRIESQCRICHFDQTSLPNYEHIKNNPLKLTELELIALQHAQDHFALEWTSYTYVVKLTGKYKLPDLRSTLERVIKDDSTELYVQSSHCSEWQNTELYVFKPLLFQNMLNIFNMWKTACMEKRFFNYNKCNISYNRLPVLRNVANYKRNFGDYLHHL
jgi:hypothetical protein